MTRGAMAALVGMLVLAACSPPSSTTPPSGAAPLDAGSTSPSEQAAAREYPVGSLPAFLADDRRFTTFLGLMERDAFLLERLLSQPDKGFTLFVPTNEAFGDLSPATQDLLSADDSAITGVVERHFLTRRLPSAEFATAYVFAGMSRRVSRLALVVDGERIWFGDARVIETDVQVAGGVVHVIASVNLGPTPDRRPIP